MASSSKKERTHEEESSRFKYRLFINFRTFIPVVGIELNPRIYVLNHPCDYAPDHLIRCNWFRKLSSSSNIDQAVCCLHPDKLAIVQCKYCVASDLPVEKSYYCCTDCFSSDWKRHIVYHLHVGEAVNADNEKGGTELRTCESREAMQFLDPGKKEWVLVGTLHSYVPTSDDLGSILKLVSVAVETGTESQLTDVNHTETNAVIRASVSQPRHMINFMVNDPKSTLEHVYSDGLTFSVMSYNVLADMYVRSNTNMYKYCESWALVWEYRRQKLLSEIIGCDADIICLQEVQSNHFESFFGPELKNCGYSSIYKTKETTSGFWCDDGERIHDGCAIFYRSKLFTVVDRKELDYSKLAQDLNEDSSYYLGRENIALIAVLQIMVLGKSDFHQPQICVANTHIVSNPKLKDVKLFQIGSFVNYLEQLTHPLMPLLICGDFNTDPSSDPYKLIVHGRCDPAFDAELDRFKVANLINLHHRMSLASAYSSFPVLHDKEELHKKMNTEAKEPLFTNRTPNFTGTLDYIFYTENHLRVEGLLDLLEPEAESLASNMPSPTWPSDHIALMAKFKLLKQLPQPKKQLTMRGPPYRHDARNLSLTRLNLG